MIQTQHAGTKRGVWGKEAACGGDYSSQYRGSFLVLFPIDQRTIPCLPALVFIVISEPVYVLFYFFLRELLLLLGIEVFMNTLLLDDLTLRLQMLVLYIEYIRHA